MIKSETNRAVEEGVRTSGFRRFQGAGVRDFNPREAKALLETIANSSRRIAKNVRVLGSVVLAAAALAPLSKPAGAQTLKVGSPAPALSVRTWVKGAPLERLEQGKMYVIEFWATWCGPCKVEIPHFVEFQRKYKDRGFTVIGLSVDDTLEQLKPFAEQYQMNYPVLLGIGNEAIQEAYGPIWGLPTAFVISRDGKICKKHMGLKTKAEFEKDILALL